MSTKRKLLVALGVFLLVVGGFVFWIWRGVPAEYTVDQLSGTDPVISEPKPETIPSVGIAKPIGWAADAAPTPAKGLVVATTRPETMLADTAVAVHPLPFRLASFDITLYWHAREHQDPGHQWFRHTISQHFGDGHVPQEEDPARSVVPVKFTLL